jgi:hypothetical protein
MTGMADPNTGEPSVHAADQPVWMLAVRFSPPIAIAF